MQANSHDDLRRWAREPVTIPVGLVLKANGSNSDTTTATLNISLSGVSVRTLLPLIPGQEVAIVIKGHFSRTIPARVMWVRKDGSRSLTIAGLKFLPYPIVMAA
jgi:hypothetical protein